MEDLELIMEQEGGVQMVHSREIMTIIIRTKMLNSEMILKSIMISIGLN